MNNEDPDYKRIYSDMISMRYPDKKNMCKSILKKRKLITLDVIELNRIIFGNKNFSQKYKSYDIESIYKILEFQKKEKCTNSQLALYFNLSRNTVTKWKRIKFRR
jgi:hypothetical protein